MSSTSSARIASLLLTLVVGCAEPRVDQDDASATDGGPASACATSGTERCEGALDEDCDGLVDEGCGCLDESERSCGTDVGACTSGRETCAGGAWGDCTGATGPAEERCDGDEDEDCDGVVDEGCACTTGAARACGSDVGLCAPGSQSCVDGTWSDCDGATSPVAERCDGAEDEDCDGVIDEGCACVDGATRPCGLGVGECVEGTETCASGAWSACVGAVGPRPEACEGAMDESCDGVVDEGCPLACSASERECTGACRACPTTGVASTSCAGSACVAATCAGGYARCGSACCATGLTWSAPTTVYGPAPTGVWLLTPAIVVEPSGPQHVTFSYANGGVDQLTFYARRTGPGADWALDDPEGTTERDSLPALAVDMSGTAHVVFSMDYSYSLRYARPTGAGWAYEGVGFGTSSSPAAIATDSMGRVHVVQTNTGGGLVRYVRSEPGVWRGDSVGSAVYFGLDPSIAIDASDGVHVAFRDRSTETLFYAYLAPGATIWTVSTVAAIGTHPSIAVGADGGVHIAYTHIRELWYAHLPAGGTAWTNTPVDADGTFGPSIGVDSANVVHIAYPQGRQLYHAANRGGTWRTTLLASSGPDEGGSRSLFVDADDRVHVVYFDIAARSIRYLVGS